MNEWKRYPGEVPDEGQQFLMIDKWGNYSVGRWDYDGQYRDCDDDLQTMKIGAFWTPLPPPHSPESAKPAVVVETAAAAAADDAISGVEYLLSIAGMFGSGGANNEKLTMTWLSDNGWENGYGLLDVFTNNKYPYATIDCNPIDDCLDMNSDDFHLIVYSKDGSMDTIALVRLSSVSELAYFLRVFDCDGNGGNKITAENLLQNGWIMDSSNMKTEYYETKELGDFLYVRVREDNADVFVGDKYVSISTMAELRTLIGWLS